MPSVVSRISSMREVSWNSVCMFWWSFQSLLNHFWWSTLLAVPDKETDILTHARDKPFPNGIIQSLQGAYAISQKSQPWLQIRGGSGGSKNILFFLKRLSVNFCGRTLTGKGLQQLCRPLCGWKREGKSTHCGIACVIETCLIWDYTDKRWMWQYRKISRIHLVFADFLCQIFK